MMKPLKRFTQCGSLTMLFAVFIVLFGVSSTALTTFGKTSPNLQQAPPPPRKPSGRDCRGHPDCNNLQQTSCVRDPLDGNLRCLCGDFLPPRNGDCAGVLKGLRHVCLTSEECNTGLICGYENTTQTTAFNRTPQLADRLCLCNTAEGYHEVDGYHKCNGANNVMAGILVPLILLLLQYFIAKK